MSSHPLSLLLVLLWPLSLSAIALWSGAAQRIVHAQSLARVVGPPILTLHSPFPPPDLPGSQAGLEGDQLPQSSAWPLRVMVFIDGSWLYYSFHGRRPNCPVTARYGDGWEFSHRVVYDRLPQLISQHLHREMLRRHQTQRFVEVARTVVFSSARADTHYHSTRLRMFRAMEAANFEVHMSTTSGAQEKCIDISLAVEMMHYATVPGAYDIAVLVSGDKDFMPALARIRQKGKRVALCSMRNCCSRDLVEPSAHVRDFDPIWLDDNLGNLIQANADALAPGAAPLTASQLLKMCTEFLRNQGGSASSRDIGRHLQSCVMNGRDALSQLKEQSMGLRSFFSTFPESFEISFAEDDALSGNGRSTRERANPGEFWVSLIESGDGIKDTQEELLIDAKIGDGCGRENDPAEAGGGMSTVDRGDASSQDWRDSTVPELRAELRQRGLPAIGRKAELIDRLQGAKSAITRQGSMSKAADSIKPQAVSGVAEDEDDQQVADTVVQYLEGCGGVASSRNVGRHLAAEGLLVALKRKHAGLFHFLQRHDNLFAVVLPSERGALEYEVRLKR